MENIIKRITAAAMAMTLLGTGTIVKNKNEYFQKNNPTLTANATYTSYKSYLGLNDYINRVIKGEKKARNITYTIPRYYYYDSAHGTAHRETYGDYTGIPNSMNCTIISVENLLVGQLRRYRGFRADNATYKTIYDDLEKVARDKYGYTDKWGLMVWNHKPFCQEIMRRYGLNNANVDTYSRYQWSITLPNTPNKTFVLSSTKTSHSILVYGKVKWHIEYISKEGYKMSEDIDFFECYDPDNDDFIVEAGEIVKEWDDVEQVMYIANYA